MLRLLHHPHLHISSLAICPPPRSFTLASPPRALQQHLHLSIPPVLASLTPLSHLPKSLADGSEYLLRKVLNGNWQAYLVSLAPIAIAVGVSHQLCIGLEGEIQVAVLRSFAQMLFLGLVLKFIFDSGHLIWSILVIMIMLLLAGNTAGEQAKQLPNGKVVATASLAVGALGSMGLMILLRVFSAEPIFLIVVTGHMLGNCMIMVGRTLKMLQYEISQHTGQIEAALALGATPYHAIESYTKRAFTMGMAPMVDAVKVMGLVSLPGNMTGLLMGGAVPLEAAKTQIKVMNAILGAAAISCLIAILTGSRMLFTSKGQLQES